ncbi:MAG TPA: group 1 glycosyl transferase, partial [Nitrospirota bacterium]|nr:group 1 glycosyl transferase [Nitrospirota bacterium]
MNGTGAAACTIASKNYLSFARTLAGSYLKNNPGSRFYLLLADRPDGCFDPGKEPFEVVEVDALGLPERERMYFQYNVLELNTAVKPYFLEYLIRERREEKVIYLDPDIFVLGSLGYVSNLLDEHQVVLTPHITSPYNDCARPNEVDILGVGVYNLGFIGVRACPETAELLKWWQAKLFGQCRHTPEKGLFVDQKWMDMAHCYNGSVHVLRDRGYNAAYWNLHEREVGKDGDRFTVNGGPLYFFHFSGIEMDKPEVVSR